MTADELVEAVAHAMRQSLYPGRILGKWDDHQRAHWYAQARAALRAVHEAMREPSAEDWALIEERCRALPDSLWSRQARIYWEEVLAAHPIAEAARDDD